MSDTAGNPSGREAAEELRDELEAIAACDPEDVPFAEDARRALSKLDTEDQ